MLEEAENSVTLLCLTASSGVPLYCRSRGGSTKQQLPFSVIGSLNGVHMFGSNLDVQLIAARTENTHVMWKVFHSSITLIVLSSEDDASDFSLGKLLDNVFNAMVLVLGLEELTHVRNIERLKKDLKSCYKLIDSFLDPGNSCADLTQCVECAVMPSRAILQECLEAFASAAESRFGCLLVGSHILCATEQWWQLAAPEAMLLVWLVPHRFLTFQLVPDMEVVLLCGPNPSLQCLTDELVNQFWQPLLDLLKATARGSARCLQPGIVLSPGILGLLLINQDQRKSLFTVHPHGASTEGSEMSMKIRLCALRSFYALVTSLYFPCEKQEEYTVPLQEDFHAGFPHCPQHCYMVYTTHKAYVIHGRQHQLFLILKSDVPTFALRSLATCTLQALTAEDSAF
ncbi:protein fuzzy homolog isoform X2 [Pantherophis guttatus]|uniref:Protein fuzzy homolog isoform X2 n=1 Tax=Pantherophis guttatus TaxID=94885 RepID=A0A6P9BUD9_PANGU|nr:protein fuzzy homolog isoform X2 [Pantherophis guttatus]